MIDMGKNIELVKIQNPDNKIPITSPEVLNSAVIAFK